MTGCFGLISGRIVAAGAVALTLIAHPALAQVAQPLDAVDVFVAATAAGDADAIAALYAPNALLLAPGAPVIGGREAIRAIHQRNAGLGESTIAFDDVKIDAGQNQAIVLWSWTSTVKPPSGDAVVQRGRSMVYFVRAEAGWFISVDMFQAGPPQ